ncbi:MAG: hypothetical protein J1F31_04210 [Erysipelotrichales bacterium]|nr:hypothetical protein [Erysipelotrichales bacterium]
MLDLVLSQRNVSTKVKISIKTLVSVLVVILSVALPQFVHIFAGSAGGVTYLPMYLPVIIGGCLLGAYWGLGVGIMSPLTSYLITSLMGNPMPIAARLPYMIVELAIFGLVSGLFSKKIFENKWMAYPAVISAILAGRLSFLAISFIFQSVSSIKGNLVWNQILNGYWGIIIQLIVVPVVVILLVKLLKKEKSEE